MSSTALDLVILWISGTALISAFYGFCVNIERWVAARALARFEAQETRVEYRRHF